jgi:hypothetical protein
VRSSDFRCSADCGHNAASRRRKPREKTIRTPCRLVGQSSQGHCNKAYSFFRLGAGATLRRHRPDRFVLRNADHTGDRLIDHVDDRVFDNRYAFSWRSLAIFDADPAVAPSVGAVVASSEGVHNFKMVRLFTMEEVIGIRKKRIELQGSYSPPDK